MEDKQAEQEEVWQKQRDDGSKAKKNQSNVAYDIMTLQYSQDKDGEHQKYLDDMGKYMFEHLFGRFDPFPSISYHFPSMLFPLSTVRYRATQRTNMLIVKGDTRVRYNIISGDDRPPLQIPDPIDRPGGQMSARVDRRLSTNPIYN
jgi:hypothetical protein